MEKLEKREYWEITSGKLEELISRNFGIDYEIIAEEEWSNGSTPIIDVGNPRNRQHYNELLDDLQGYISGDRWSINIYGLMDLLSLKGIIPTGNYIIDHSW